MRSVLRAILVFMVLGTAPLQARTGFLDHIPGAGQSRAVEGINALLGGLASTIGSGATVALLTALSLGVALLVYWRDASTLPRPAGSPSRSGVDRPLSDADRQFMADLVTGFAGQVAHEQGMADLRGRETVVVRLAPQIPVNEAEPSRSWLGGEPALPETVAWPEIDGRRANFLAQICCADLPSDLWGGVGPRHGWLAFFIHPTDYAVKVLHLDAPGPFRSGPAFSDDGWLTSPVADERLGGTFHAFPRWPVDLMAVRPGLPDPRREGRSPAYDERFRQGYDLTSPERQPFTWSLTLAMLDIVETRVSTFAARIAEAAPTHDAALERVRLALAEAERASTPPDNLIHLRNQAQALPKVVELAAQRRALIEAAVPRIRAVVDQARERASRQPFSEAALLPILEALHAIDVMTVRRRDDKAGGPGAETVTGRVLPLTTYDPDGSLWLPEFEALRTTAAQYAYSRSPSSLPRPVRAYFEALWRDLAAHEMAGTGHVPFGYVHEFDVREDVTLLELPSSALTNWMFGDVDNLVVTIKRADLAAGRFDAATAQVSN